MKKGTTWLNYIEALKDRSFDPCKLKPEGIENFLKMSQCAAFQHSMPMLYLLDYTSGKYVTMSESVKPMMGFTPDDFVKGGVGFTLENYHRDDLQLFSNQIFAERISLLSTIPFGEHSNYMFSYNFRFLNKEKEYVNLLQRNFFISDEGGSPLMSMGMIVNINHFKSYNPVIQTVDKLSYDPAVAPVNIYRKAFYLNDENKLITRREKEVLLWTAEGLTSREIADKLCISENTIINHRRNMQEKTNTRNVVELVSFSIRNGII